MANAIYPLYKQALLSAETNVSLISGALANAIVVTGATESTGKATLTCADTSIFKVGDIINVSGISPADFNGSFTVTEVTATTISYTVGAGTYTGFATVAITDISGDGISTATATVADTTFLTVGDFVNISGSTSYNGNHKIISKDTLFFTFASTASTTGETGTLSGTFRGPPVKVSLIDNQASGGTYSEAHDFYDDVSTAALSSQTIENTTLSSTSVFDGDDITFVNVTGNESEALVVWIDTGTPATSRLVAYMDSGITGLPITPTQGGGDIDVLWNASGIFRL